MITTAYIRQLQFIAAGVGCGAAGKNKKIYATNKNVRAAQLTKRPAFPRLKREGRRGLPEKRRTAMQVMAIM